MTSLPIRQGSLPQMGWSYSLQDLIRTLGYQQILRFVVVVTESWMVWFVSVSVVPDDRLHPLPDEEFDLLFQRLVVFVVFDHRTTVGQLLHLLLLHPGDDGKKFQYQKKKKENEKEEDEEYQSEQQEEQEHDQELYDDKKSWDKEMKKKKKEMVGVGGDDDGVLELVETLDCQTLPSGRHGDKHQSQEMKFVYEEKTWSEEEEENESEVQFQRLFVSETQNHEWAESHLFEIFQRNVEISLC